MAWGRLLAAAARWGVPPLLCLLVSCGGGGGGSTSGDDPGAAKLALDSGGTLQTTATATGPNGSRLTLRAGTRILIVDPDGQPQPPASLNGIQLALVEAPEPLPPLPEGITLLGRLRIVVTVDGVERQALFLAEGEESAEAPAIALVLASDQGSNDPMMGLLFYVESGGLVRLGSSLPEEAALEAGKIPVAVADGGTAARQMEFDPRQTGSYVIGKTTPGPAAPAPEGVFWSSFVVPDPGCIPVNNVNVCGPSVVDRVEIIEESTAEVLGICWFAQGDTASTGVLPPGYQFWCRREQDPSGDFTRITLSSMQANLPLVHAHRVRAADSLPMWDQYLTAEGGLHGPDGTVYTDPYTHKEFEFAGYKHLIFTTDDKKKDYRYMIDHALTPLQLAGYKAVLGSSRATASGYIAKIPVFETLDARVLMQEDVVVKDHWKVVTAPKSTYGNLGNYAKLVSEWSGTLTHQTDWNVTDLGTWQGEGSFQIRFKADLNDIPEPDEQGQARVPFVLEDDAVVSWSVAGTLLGESVFQTGSANNLLSIDYTNPDWYLFPAGDFLAGDGYVDLVARQLHLFLIGVGDENSFGTFNLAVMDTDCAYSRDPLGRVHLVLEMDDQFNITDGSCVDRIVDSDSNTQMATGRRSWNFTLRPPELP